jgi:hypothetical protein
MNEITQLAKPKDGPAPRWFHIAVAISMITSASSALIATLHTGRTMTALVEQNAKLVRANSTPILEFGHGNLTDAGEHKLNFTVRNVGSGLARVVWFELRLDGKPMPAMRNVIDTLSPGLKGEFTTTTGPVANRVFAPGTDQQVFGWRRPPDSDVDVLKAWTAVDKARFERIKVEACYCSVFQECWTSSLDGALPKPVEQCTAEGHTVLKG